MLYYTCSNCGLLLWSPYAPANVFGTISSLRGVSGVSVVVCSCVEERWKYHHFFVPFFSRTNGLGRVGRGVTVCVVVVRGCGSNYAHQESRTRRSNSPIRPPPLKHLTLRFRIVGWIAASTDNYFQVALAFSLNVSEI